MPLFRIITVFIVLGVVGFSPWKVYAQEGDENDPMEYVNRGILDANMFLDRTAFRPLAQGYRFIFPEIIRDSVRNALRNLLAPTILANDLLQGKFERGATTIMRFTINSTVGVVGLFDIATSWDIEPHVEDFGQTLAVWGVPEGPYLMLPLLGPSNPRDLVGGLVDSFADPFRIAANHEDKNWTNFTRAGLIAIDRREQQIERFEDLRRTAIDLYATIRSLYRQDRLDKIHDGKLPLDGEGSPFGYTYMDFENGD